MKYLSFVFLGFMLYCSTPGNNVEEVIPQTLRMVEKTDSSDFSASEKGIDAVPNFDAIKVEWYAPSDSLDIEKYRIYRSADPNGLIEYEFLHEIIVTNVFDQTTEYIDQTAGVDTMYHYYVTSINDDNNEAANSDTASYRLLAKATLSDHSLTNNGIPRITFPFNVSNPFDFNEFILRIEDYNSRELIMTRSFEPDPYGEPQQSAILSGDDLLPLQNGNSYEWRIDILSGDPKENGSESNWKLLIIN